MQLKLALRKPESPGVESFIFQPAAPLTWKAGQYLHYMLHHEPTDDRGSDRWFTIASAPFERHVMITTRFAREKGSTFKKNLKALKPGDTLEISGVDGDFILGDTRKDYVFIAGGIGITPFRSILKEAAHAGKRLRVTLLYANRNANVTYKKELDAMAKRNPNFIIHYLFSPERIDKDTVRKLAPAWKKSLFYVSGPEPMVESVGKMLQKIGVRKKHIKQDWFPGYPAD
ncbi:MAG TPA: FAD-dependent oxidoreductase [Verrucomicrobiae bacterium]|jgi:ferredoxin-NADP reductase